MGDAELMRNRSWRWLRVRIAGCLSTESRLQRWYVETHRPAGQSTIEGESY